MAWIVSSWVPGLGLLVGALSFFTGLLYPTWESFRAIESSHSGDDTQWLTYWVCACTLLLIEKVAWPVLYWVPLYGVMRLLFLAWMVHPATKGATFLYEEFIRPLLMVAGQTLKDIPVLAPLVSDFTPAAGRVHAKAAPPSSAAESASPNLDAIKAEAMQRGHETFERAKQSAASEEEGPLERALKSHAT